MGAVFCQLRQHRLQNLCTVGRSLNLCVSCLSSWSHANRPVPIVPYLQHGGQAPLRGLLPSSLPPSSIGPVDIPEYPQAVIYSSQTPAGTPDAAPDASRDDIVPTIDIPIDYSLHEHPSEQSLSSAGGQSDASNTQMKGRKPAIAAAGTFFGLFSFSQIYQHFLFESLTPADERADERAWVASSHSWVDRKVCDWFGMCGISHLNQAAWTTPKVRPRKQKSVDLGNDVKINLTDFWNDAKSLPDDWEAQEEREIPQYVIDYAPLIHLYSGEEYWPGDIAEHLIHTTPHLNYTPLQAKEDHPNLTNLGELNRWGRFVYLQSDDNVEDRPEWLGGGTNIPNVPKDGNDDDDDDDNWDDHKNGHYEEDKNGEKSEWWHVGIGDTKDKGGIRTVSSSPSLPVPTKTPEGEELVDDDDSNWQPELRNRRRSVTGKKVVGGRSDAPAVLIVVPKGDGVVDAFWFFFYSYNLGNAVFNVRFGNHVGDWEHTVVRFQDGQPKAVFFSEHSFGEAYTWDAIEKSGKRVRSTCVNEFHFNTNIM